MPGSYLQWNIRTAVKIACSRVYVLNGENLLFPVPCITFTLETGSIRPETKEMLSFAQLGQEAVSAKDSLVPAVLPKTFAVRESMAAAS